jgi:drug/metabolite transporter (DMT)-like permease
MSAVRPIRTGWRAPSPVAQGLAWATVTILIAASWPVVTRLGITRQALSPLELATLRYAAAGLLFLPVLLRMRRTLPLSAWLEGAILAACQGAPLAILIGTGLQHAPAAHASALTLGLMPAITVLILAALGTRPTGRAILGSTIVAFGGIALAGVDLAAGGGALMGYAMFVAAAIMGSIYFVRLRRSGLTPVQGAAFVAVFSGVGSALALACMDGMDGLVAAGLPAISFQVLFQGVLVGGVSLITLNRAIALLGAAPATLCLSLVPAVTTLLGTLVLGERPLPVETAAIAAMVCGAALFGIPRPAGAGGPSGTPPNTVASVENQAMGTGLLQSLLGAARRRKTDPATLEVTV